MSKKSIPKKNTVTSTRRNTPTPQEQDEYNYQSEQPLTRNPGESNGDYYHRQKATEQKQTENKEKPQKPGLVQRGIQKGKNYANDKINKAKEYGTQKGKEALGKGAEYAKGKGQEFLAKNPKVAEKINKAKEAKENFENRMDGMKENLQSAPIKQEPGESSYAFRRRQQKQDDESPDNIKNRSLKDVAGQRLRTDTNKGVGKGIDFAKKKGNKFLKNNPKAAEAAEKLKIFNKKRHEDIKRLKAKLNAAKAVKKKINDEVKRIKMEIAKAVARFTLQIIAYIISALASIATPLLVVVLIIVVIIVALKYTCDSNPFFDAACSYFIGI